jgi:hypothetical protein
MLAAPRGGNPGVVASKGGRSGVIVLGRNKSDALTAYWRGGFWKFAPRAALCTQEPGSSPPPPPASLPG